MCKVFTGNIRAYQGRAGLDITLGSARTREGLLFVPPNWSMVKRVIYNRHSPQFDEIWSDYVAEFYAAIRARYKVNPQAYVDFLYHHEEIHLLCFCEIGQRCHRDLVVDILDKIADYHNIPFERGGISGD